MRPILIAAATLVLPGVTMAHVAIVEHAHPHASGHPYPGVDVILVVAAVVLAGGTIGHAIRQRLRSGK